MCLPEKNFSDCRVIMALSMFVSLVVVSFVGLSLLLHIASIGIILRHMDLQLQRLSFPVQLFSPEDK